MHLKTACVLAAIAAPAIAQPTFTYQGRFTDAGQPADGTYDVVVRLYDAQTGGTLLTSAQMLDMDIDNGLFTMEVPAEAPPGTPLFDGSERWIEVGFRPQELTIFDPYTLLDRQRVTFAPQATHALHAVTANALANPIWQLTAFPFYAYFGNGNDRVFINSESGIGNSTLLVNADTNGQSSVAITTTGANGKPGLFFKTGFGQGAGVGDSMILEFDGSDGTLTFNASDGSDIAQIAESGIQAVDFEYNEPETRRISISPAAWIPKNDMSYRLVNDGQNFRSYIDQTVTSTESMVAPVSLPDGSTIESVQFYFRLNGGGTMQASLFRTANNGSAAAFVATANLSQSNPSPTTVLADPQYAIVDNGIFNYYLQASSDDWGSLPSVAIGGTVIRCSVSEPD